MTSSRLFCNLLRENIKRQLWSIVLLLLAWFFCFPVLSAMDMVDKTISTLYDLNQIYGATSPMLTLITVIAAIVLAMSCFKHLHSSRMTDCYHALPVKRELLFASQYLAGVVIYLATYLLGILAMLLVLMWKGILVKYLLANVFYGYLMFALMFLLIYTITVLAVELTGKLIISVLGTLYLNFYALIVYGLFMSLGELFFSTYSSRSAENVFHVTQWLAPFSRLYKNFELMDQRPKDCIFRMSDHIWNDQPQLLSRLEGTTMVVTPLPAGVLLGTLAMIVVLLVISVVLFKKRRSESAGSAMAFSISRPIVKFLTVLPAGTGIGIFFYMINSERSLGWLFFGTVCGALIVCCAMEVIYQADIRAMFRKKWDLLVGVVLSLLLTCFFRFDWGGYDRYLPEKEDLKGVSILFSFEDWASRWDLSSPKLDYNWDYQLTEECYYDMDVLYPLLEYLTEHISEEEVAKPGYYAVTSEVAYGSYKYDSVYVSSWYTLDVTYRLKNGKEVHRDYTLDLSDSKLRELVSAVYESEEYKEMLYAIYHEEVMDCLAGLSMQGYFDSVKYTDTKASREFLEIYKEEFKGLTFDEVLENQSVYCIGFLIDPDKRITSEDDYYHMETLEYPVYASFTKTIAWLEEHMQLELEQDFIDGIQRMYIYDNVTGNSYELKRSKDAELIAALSKYLVEENQFMIYDGYRYYVELMAMQKDEEEKWEDSRYYYGYLASEDAVALLQNVEPNEK